MFVFFYVHIHNQNNIKLKYNLENITFQYKVQSRPILYCRCLSPAGPIFQHSEVDSVKALDGSETVKSPVLCIHAVQNVSLAGRIVTLVVVPSVRVTIATILRLVPASISTIATLGTNVSASH